jgi:predicted nucleotidyltransferase component of viral defense system
MRTRTDLVQLAGQYANERRVPAATIIKEILHYEILYALVQSGAASHLTFQGGTALRLCYQGNRYSEDLDFVGGVNFSAQRMEPFGALLRDEIAAAYGLELDIKAPKVAVAGKDPGPAGSDTTVAVARWSARVTVPTDNRAERQKQVINIEVASVPAYDIDLIPVTAYYPHLPAPLRQILVAVETRREILADKIVALGAREFLKARDIWDIKFLLDAGVLPDFALVAKKLVDYGWEPEAFKAKLAAKLEQLQVPQTAVAFHTEMTRFVDASAAAHLAGKQFADIFLRRSFDLGQLALAADLAVPGSGAAPALNR